MLKAIPETRDADPRALGPVVRRWHRLALSRITTPDFAVTWARFSGCVGAGVRSPHGSAVRAVTAAAAGQGIEKLADCCRLLQLKAGDAPFFLGLPHRGQSRRSVAP